MVAVSPQMVFGAPVVAARGALKIANKAARTALRTAEIAHDLYQDYSPIKVGLTSATVDKPYQLGIAPHVKIKKSATGSSRFTSGAGWGLKVTGEKKADKVTGRSAFMTDLPGKRTVSTSWGSARGGKESDVRHGPLGFGIGPDSAKISGNKSTIVRTKPEAKKESPKAKANIDRSTKPSPSEKRGEAVSIAA